MTTGDGGGALARCGARGRRFVVRARKGTRAMGVDGFVHGQFCWAELGARDARGAGVFYAELFGWSCDEAPRGHDAVYTTMRLGGRAVAGLDRSPSWGARASTQWRVYAHVDDVDATTRRARELGAAVLVEPFDVMQLGRMSTLRDPTGAELSLWQPRAHRGFGAFAEPNALCWFELATHDPKRARAFYSELLGWMANQSANDTGYTEFTPKGLPYPMAALRAVRDEGDARWSPYCAVVAIDAVVARARSLGGTVLVAPRLLDHAGRAAVVRDPQGACFALIEMAAY